MANGVILKHWPTLLLGVVVAGMLLVAVFTYQVNETEVAVLTRFSQVQPNSPESGLHFRWPYPFEDVIKFDRRIRCFEGNSGKLEEASTADQQSILVGIYVNYAITDATRFYSTMVTVSRAEDRLNSQMRSAKTAAFGAFRFDQILSSDPKNSCLGEIEKRMQKDLHEAMKPFGIDVSYVGVSQINLPEAVSAEIVKRMIAERDSEAQIAVNHGKTRAAAIRIAADTEKAKAVADAEARAKEIRAQGDAAAVQYYAVFKQAPELAAFLRKLDALRSVMKTRTTLVLDTDAAPFDLLNQFRTGKD